MIIAVIAIMAVASVGVAFAYSSVTNSENNNLDSDAYLVATDSYGDTDIQISPVRYLRAGTGVYLPEFEGSTVEGQLEAKSPSGSSQMRMWVTMQDPMSWTVIQRIILIVDYDDESKRVERTCFDWNNVIPQTGAATEVIPIDDGTHTFRISVTYRSNVSSDPNAYSQNFASGVVFVQGTDGNDPLTPPSP